MTRISIIAGTIARDEILDRAAEVKPTPFFNPLVMTEGQAYLTLVRDQALTLAQYYPDNPMYKKAVSMADNALYKGIGGCYAPYVGSVEPTLYPVARAIQIFKNKQQPAIQPKNRGIGSWAAESLVAGEIPQVTNEFVLWWWANDTAYLKSKFKDISQLKTTLHSMKDTPPPAARNDFEKHWIEFSGKYDYLKYVVDLYNNTINKFAHHPLYNWIPKTKEVYPAEVVTKSIWHAAGVQSMAAAGDFSLENMAMWTRNGILQANIKGNAGAISPELTCFQYTGLPDSVYTEWLNGKQVVTSNKKDKIGEAAMGNPILLAILAIVSAAIAYAQTVQQGINQKRATAFAGVQGWGTKAYSAEEADWMHYQEQLDKQTAGGQDSGISLPMVAAGAAAAYFLLK